MGKPRDPVDHIQLGKELEKFLEARGWHLGTTDMNTTFSPTALSELFPPPRRTPVLVKKGMIVHTLTFVCHGFLRR